MHKASAEQVAKIRERALANHEEILGASSSADLFCDRQRDVGSRQQLLRHVWASRCQCLPDGGISKISLRQHIIRDSPKDKKRGKVDSDVAGSEEEEGTRGTQVASCMEDSAQKPTKKKFFQADRVNASNWTKWHTALTSLMKDADIISSKMTEVLAAHNSASNPRHEP